ncbi:hypothetical protein N7495_004040 [Penicillium taxi]|uniref:uncharacterized protein n=1 Tax=Penicillium taxi TaxID=168475 RepID=UPI0025452AE5|nr:uncharacterized protein N7495_004040 [Penicillium taxi]KAJ5899296.1 hypothetical protein N7495_004040 [Penicillium taxi]
MDFLDDPPNVDQDLYLLLGVTANATTAEIKTAYKRMALKHHPDKVHEALRDEANSQFQKIAFAYGILSDDARRRAYDDTGRTTDAEFEWADFVREQFKAVISDDMIIDFKNKYQGSDEEKNDLLDAYVKSKGNMGKIYQSIMLSNPLDDEHRFREIIDKAIADGEVDSFKAYVKESAKSRAGRLKTARTNAKEAEQSKKEFAAKKKAASKPASDSLAALIANRHATRESDNFISRIEQKYGGGKKRKCKEPLEPSEEAFAAVAARKRSKP